MGSTGPSRGDNPAGGGGARLGRRPAVSCIPHPVPQPRIGLGPGTQRPDQTKLRRHGKQHQHNTYAPTHPSSICQIIKTDGVGDGCGVCRPGAAPTHLGGPRRATDNVTRRRSPRGAVPSGPVGERPRQGGAAGGANIGGRATRVAGGWPSAGEGPRCWGRGPAWCSCGWRSHINQTTSKRDTTEQSTGKNKQTRHTC